MSSSRLLSIFPRYITGIAVLPAFNVYETVRMSSIQPLGSNPSIGSSSGRFSGFLSTLDAKIGSFDNISILDFDNQRNDIKNVFQEKISLDTPLYWLEDDPKLLSALYKADPPNYPPRHKTIKIRTSDPLDVVDDSLTLKYSTGFSVVGGKLDYNVQAPLYVGFSGLGLNIDDTYLSINSNSQKLEWTLPEIRGNVELISRRRGGIDSNLPNPDGYLWQFHTPTADGITLSEDGKSLVHDMKGQGYIEVTKSGIITCNISFEEEKDKVLTAIEEAKVEALGEIDTSKVEALGEISTSKAEALGEIGALGTEITGAIGAQGAAIEASIGAAGFYWTGAVSLAGTGALASIGIAAGNVHSAITDGVNQINGLRDSSLSDISTSRDDAVNQINGLLDPVTGRITILESDNTSNKNRLTVLETSGAGNNQGIIDLQNRVTDVENVNNLQDQILQSTGNSINYLQDRINTHETTLTSYGTRITSIEGILPTKTDLSVYQAYVTSNNSRISTIEGILPTKTDLSVYQAYVTSNDANVSSRLLTSTFNSKVDQDVRISASPKFNKINSSEVDFLDASGNGFMVKPFSLGGTLQFFSRDSSVDTLVYDYTKTGTNFYKTVTFNTDISVTGTVFSSGAVTSPNHLTTKDYVDSSANLRVLTSVYSAYVSSNDGINSTQNSRLTSIESTLTSNINQPVLTSSSPSFTKVTSTSAPTNASDLTTKAYVDSQVNTGVGSITAGTGLSKSGSTLSVNAAQTQVTSIGTLTGLSVSGNATVTSTQTSTSASTAALQASTLGVTGTSWLNNALINGAYITASTTTGEAAFSGQIVIPNTYTNSYSAVNFGQVNDLISASAATKQPLNSNLTALNQNVSTSSNPNFVKVNVTSTVNNGGSSLAPPEDMFRMYRGGVPSQSYANIVSLQLSRGYVDSTYARTKLSFLMSNLTSTLDSTPMTITSDGAVVIANSLNVPYINAVNSIITNGLTVSGSSSFTGTVTVPTPVNPTDSTTKSYVDAQISTGVGSITAGTGLSKSGTTLSVNASQTQVTSVGTLTGLTVSGVTSINSATVTSTQTATSASTAALQSTTLGVSGTTWLNNALINGAYIAASTTTGEAAFSGQIIIPNQFTNSYSAVSYSQVNALITASNPTAGTGLTRTGNIFSVNPIQNQITTLNTVSVVSLNIGSSGITIGSSTPISSSSSSTTYTNWAFKDDLGATRGYFGTGNSACTNLVYRGSMFLESSGGDVVLNANTGTGNHLIIKKDTGAVSMSSSLTVSGLTTLNGGVNAGGVITCGTISSTSSSTGTLVVSGLSTLTGTVTTNGNLVSNNSIYGGSNGFGFGCQGVANTLTIFGDNSVTINNTNLIPLTSNGASGGALNIAGNVTLANGTKNHLLFNNVGVAPPSYTNRSVGTKIIYYPTIGASSSDWAVGMDNNTLWNNCSTPSGTFKWYGGTNLASTLTGTGDVTFSNSVTVPYLNVSALASINTLNVNSSLNVDLYTTTATRTTAGSTSSGTAYTIQCSDTSSNNYLNFRNSVGNDIYKFQLTNLPVSINGSNLGYTFNAVGNLAGNINFFVPQDSVTATTACIKYARLGSTSFNNPNGTGCAMFFCNESTEDAGRFIFCNKKDPYFGSVTGTPMLDIRSTGIKAINYDAQIVTNPVTQAGTTQTYVVNQNHYVKRNRIIDCCYIYQLSATSGTASGAITMTLPSNCAYTAPITTATVIRNNTIVPCTIQFTANSSTCTLQTPTGTSNALQNTNPSSTDSWFIMFSYTST